MGQRLAGRQAGAIRRRAVALVATLAVVALSAPPVLAVDLTPPAVNSLTPDVTSTAGGSVSFTLQFTEPVLGLAKADFQPQAAGLTGCAVDTLTAIPASTTGYTITVAGCVAALAGTLAMRLSSGSVTDASGNPGPTTPATSSTVLVDQVGPVVSTPGLSASLVAPEAVITVTASIVDGSTIASAEVSVAGGPWQAMAAQDGAFNSAAETATWSGSAPAASYVQQPYAVCVRATDGLDNISASSACATLTVTDTVAPDAVIVPVSEPRGAAPGTHTFAIGFPEAVTGLALGDLRVVDQVGAATGCTLENLSGALAYFTVDVSGCSDGLVAVELLANAVTDAHAHTGPASAVHSGDLTADLTAPDLQAGAPWSTIVRAGSLGGIAVKASDANGVLGVYATVNGSLPPSALLLDPASDWTVATASATLGAVVDLAAGARHACAVLEDGTVRCWGDNRMGQAGFPGGSFTGTPTVVAGIAGATAVAAGEAHTCVLRRDRTVWCWGDGRSGQAGAGIAYWSATPVQVGGISTAVQIAAGGDTSCAALADGTARCWGRGSYGQLGDGSLTATSPTPVAVADLSGVTDIAVGPRSACAVNAGAAYCWGVNWAGEIGDGTNGSHPSPSAVVGLPSAATSIVAGEAFACAVVADLSTWCWGGGLSNGLLGDGTRPGTAASAVASAYTNVAGLAAGSDRGIVHSGATAFLCAIDASDHAVRCSGSNTRAELGRATTLDGATAALVGDLGPSAKVVAGDGFACSLGTQGDVACWGDTSLGQTGSGTGSLATRPHGARDLYSPSSIAVGPTGACETIGSRIAKCWGVLNGTKLSLYPVNLPGIVGTLSTVQSIDVGRSHVCAVLIDRVGRCWGLGTSGQLGNNGTSTSATPVDVAGLVTATAITVGLRHSCAVRADGTIVCWGENTVGQLGTGDTTSHAVPVQVATITAGATAVDSQALHTCAVVSGGIVCWGANDEGQLGNGTSGLPATEPQYVGYKNALDVAVGDAHSCALLATGNVTCWGANGAGQLGNGSTIASSSPVLVSGVSGATDIAAGSDFTCAVTGASLVKCWGGSQIGLRGDGTLNLLPSTPTAIPGTDGATAIDAAGGSVCVTFAVGDVACWGDNTFGQLQAGESGAEGAATPPRDGLALVPTGVAGLVGGLAEGANEVCLQAVDFAGNHSTVKCSTITRTSDVTPPVATITSPATPTNLATLGYEVAFDEPVTGFGPSDISFAGSTATGCTVAAPFTDLGASWGVGVSGCSAGTVVLSVLAGSVEDVAGNPGPFPGAAATPVVVDRTAPAAIVATWAPTTAVALPSPSSVSVRLTWSTVTDPSGIVEHQVRRSTDGGSTWTTFPGTTTGTSYIVTPTTGQATRYCVVAVDGAGNQSACVAGTPVTASIVQQTAASISYAGTWSTQASAGFSAGSLKYATAAGASATATFTGRSIALVTTVAANRGKVKILQGSTLLAVVDLAAGPRGNQRVVWQKTWPTAVARTIRIVGLGTTGRPRIDVDAFVILR